MTPTRREHDLLGERDLAADTPWGIHTLRACENFPFRGARVHPDLLDALVRVKLACVRANRRLGYLPEATASAIEAACGDWLAAAGRACPLPALQGGAGTSTNLHVNECLANLALKRLGCPAGDYATVHPIEHVNLHQSTNDVYPTAVRIAVIARLQQLSARIAELQGALQDREAAWHAVLSIGRTELQDAVPVTLGAQFAALAESVARDRWRVAKGTERLRTVNLGGTAVGTGLTAPRDYIFQVIEDLRAVTALNVARGDHLMDATANADALVEVAGLLDAHAATLGKVCRDLRLLHAFGEVRLPAVQAGSSMMPGKVNPVIAEAGIQAGLRAHAVLGLVGTAAAEGSLQINEFMPLMAESLLEACDLLEAADTALAPHVRAAEADPARCRARLDASPALVTALVPRLGYEAAQTLAQELASSARTDVRRFLAERVGEDVVAQALAPASLMALGHRRDP